MPLGNRRSAKTRGRGLPVDPAQAEQDPQQGGQQPVHRSVSMPFGEVAAPAGWDALPALPLSQLLDLLPPRDLAAAACACKAWRAAVDHEAERYWGKFWRHDAGEQPLWGWAKAGGGLREQLRARASVQKGDCIATVFPLSRREGPVVEVLMRDGGGWQRIVTAQTHINRSGSTRLRGATVKVWDAASLASQRPLLVVHDCLKHLQLEDGRLLLWRVANDAIVRTKCLDPGDAVGVSEAAAWAEHSDIVPSLLDPATLALKDVPLQSRFGSGNMPYEWMDMFSGCLGCVMLVAGQMRMRARIFNVDSGVCLRESVCAIPDVEGAPDWGAAEVSCIMSRSADMRSPLLVAALLFDVRTFMWRLPPAPFGRCGAVGAAAAGQVQQEQQQGDGDAAAGAGVGQQQGQQGSLEGTGAGAAEVEWGQLQHMYITPDLEPVVDVSVSTASGRVFVVGLENIFLLGLDGQPIMVVNMGHWRGASPPLDEFAPMDLGAFSWPLPTSSKAAFYLDSCSSLYLAEFRRPLLADYMRIQTAAVNAGDPRFPHFAAHLAMSPLGGAVNQPYMLQSHTDLRPSMPGGASILAGRGASKMQGSQQEPVIVEYTQEGSTVFTVGDASCAAVSKLLKLEKDRGSYVQGLGPGAGGGSRGNSRRMLTGGNGGGSKASVAPRAVVCIDAATGCRFKTVPIEGVVEAIHSTGQYLLVAVAGKESYPEGPIGSLVVLDFTKEPGGFGGRAQQAQAAAGAAGRNGRRVGGQGEGQEGSPPRPRRSRKQRCGGGSAKQQGEQGGGAAAGGGGGPAAAGKKRAKRK